ncbi:hypothetical protein AArc1_0203 [Natrarchaeobaculum sulfurireducens]|uniref:Uncharacterized protein n=1 Tax=Natrarchaeobaculum sulfurireducens TaxID=2044521 RepID=A0A346PAK2_9EURY|nr:hypothetical protein AArc1_0203 [Natrarchaeobaculum sulfurireducens]
MRVILSRGGAVGATDCSRRPSCARSRFRRRRTASPETPGYGRAMYPSDRRTRRLR